MSPAAVAEMWVDTLRREREDGWHDPRELYAGLVDTGLAINVPALRAGLIEAGFRPKQVAKVCSLATEANRIRDGYPLAYPWDESTWG